VRTHGTLTGVPPLAPPSPPLRDDRVVLRPLRADDAAAWARAFVDDPALGWLAGEPADPTEAELRERITAKRPAQAAEGSALDLAITEPPSVAFCGSVLLHHVDWTDLRAEVGVFLVPAARGRGLAARAVALLTDHALGPLGLGRVQAMTFPENAAMRAAWARAGYVEEGVLREYALERGRRRDFVLAARLASDRREPG
jgi:RimJ/RimL family protein N-acetyltransferase